MAKNSGMRVRVHNLEVPLDVANTATDALGRAVASRLGVAASTLGMVTVVRRALDVRQGRPRYAYSVDVQVDRALGQRLLQRRLAEAAKNSVAPRWRMPRVPDGPPPVVVGAGPAGLLAALTLAEAGWAPVLLERGRPVESRARDVSKLYSQGVLNPMSNVCYGEGGAGTFSDGKLYTRVGDGRVDAVMQQLVTHGADADILIDNRPHLGTDRLVALLKSIRARLESLGTQIFFERDIVDIAIRDQAVQGVTTADGSFIAAPQVVLATGHSARDVWDILQARGLPLEARPFAVGFRVEHPQPMIDEMRYGQTTGDLPAADYRLVFTDKGKGAEARGVYSFCMCPGGVVVTTPTRPGELCINGMSHASRRGRYANSALVVTVTPADFAAAGHTGVFAGVDFQEAAERAAYDAGGGAFVAPACRLADFAAGKMSSALGASSYRRGLWPADLTTLYPPSISLALQQALPRFNRTLRGFITNEATLIGVETRTASPIRVPRGDNMQALGAQGLYPAGEGMGYGGGIVSAAVDGVRAAEALLERAGAVAELGVTD